jgi:hypothetical protein
MNWYVETVIAFPIITAMIQFAILGTLGDMISKWVIQKRIFLPFTYKTVILKMLEWAFLAVCIKYAFVGFSYFVQGLVEKNLLPGLNYFWEAFAISATMNLQFGPFLVIMHRLLDNLINREKNWANLDKGMYSLLWFWLPAHTITFMLPKPFQIGLAALWSVVLGLILGYYNSKKK